jgi:cytochrome P450
MLHVTDNPQQSALARSPLPRPKEPGLVTALRFGNDMFSAPMSYFEQYGDTLTMRLFGVPYVVTRDPLWIADVLVKYHASFIKDSVTRGLGSLLGQGLLVSEGEPWRARRKAMQPHFQPTQLEGLLKGFAEETARETATWRTLQVVDLNAATTRIALGIALRSLFGATLADIETFERSLRHATDYFTGVAGTMITLPLWLPTPTNVRYQRARRHLRSAVAQLIQNAQAEDAAAAVGTPLGNLLAARSASTITDEQLLDEAITLLLAGHETSSATLTYTLGLIAAYPAVQSSIAEELARDGVPSSLRQLQQPSALRRALTESMRLYPASWAVGREVRTPIEIQGQLLAKGTQILVHQWAAHRHPHWFPNPSAFEPSRWSEDFTAGLPKCLYAPFGAGPRVCIGQHFALAELMVALGTVLSQFQLTAVSVFPPALQASITTRPLASVTVRIEARAGVGPSTCT